MAGAGFARALSAAWALSAGLALALLAAAGYTLATFFLKAALGRGATAGQINLWANVAMGVLTQPVWLAVPAAPAGLWPMAAACGGTFFLGQVFTFAALARGDVSVATPLLGTKILWVAALSAGLFNVPLSAKWWTAAATASLGVAIVAASQWQSGQCPSWRSAGFALAAAASYSMTDVLVQQWQGPGLSLLPATFALVALLAVAFYGWVERRAFLVPRRPRAALVAGAALLALQCAMMYLALAWMRDATAVNVMYSSRSLMSVAGAWLAGHWFGLRESSAPRRVLLLRLVGAALLFLAILLIFTG